MPTPPSFLHPDFFLTTEAAQRLYHEYAAPQPIFDYHCHLPPDQIAQDKTFANLTEIWLDGDHYKWRAMRANGIEETYITGPADPYERFLKWVETMPYCLRNPLYTWSHLELRRYFDCDLTIEPKNAQEIWDTCNALLPNLSAQQILRQFNVTFVGTTDDPADSLEHHESIKRQNLKSTVAPTYRPDNAFKASSKSYKVYLNRLSQVTRIAINGLDDLLAALRARHDDFEAAGCRATDGGFAVMPAPDSRLAAQKVFEKVMNGEFVGPEDESILAGFLAHIIAQWTHEKGWAMQLHLGPFRNTNKRAFEKLGPDTGFDSIGDHQQGEALRLFLDELAKKNRLPKTILYNNNPNDNYLFATMAQNFQDATHPGKIQFGAGWWHLDQKEGIEWQLNALSNVGLLRRFVGMVTDSRSFLSFPRHEYFRRVLCNLLGQEMERGELPPDVDLIGQMVKEICHTNAQNYFVISTEAERNGEI